MVLALTIFRSIRIGVEVIGVQAIEVITLITINQAMAMRSVIVIKSLSMKAVITLRKRKVTTPIILTSRTIVGTIMTMGVTMGQMEDTTPMVQGRGKGMRPGWLTLATSDMAFEEKQEEKNLK